MTEQSTKHNNNNNNNNQTRYEKEKADEDNHKNCTCVLNVYGRFGPVYRTLYTFTYRCLYFSSGGGDVGKRREIDSKIKEQSWTCYQIREMVIGRNSEQEIVLYFLIS